MNRFRTILHRSHLTVAVVLLVFAIVLGGGGSPNPSTELMLGLLAGVAAMVWLWLPGRRGAPEWSLWLVMLLVAIVPLVQLVPLPPSIWTALPGREAELAALELVGAADSWRPLSTSPMLTLSSLLALAPPLILLWMTAALSRQERTWLICAIAGLAILSALIGVLQLAGGAAAPKLYAASHPFVITGFQANRNATADVLLIGIAALAAFAAASIDSDGSQRRGKRSQWPLIGGAALLILACIFTASRAGVALILPVVIASWGIVALSQGRERNRKIAAVASGFITLMLAALFVLLQQNSALQKVAGRFDFVEDGRQTIWADTISAIGEYWPAGSGIGTFVPTFIALEPLESVDPSTPNRAHNDYLEIALEAGVPGLVILAVLALLLMVIIGRAWKARPTERTFIAFGVVTLAIIAAHSITDYPLRSMSLACLAAIAAGMFFPSPASSTAPAASQGGRKDQRAGNALPRLLLSALLVMYSVAVFGRGVDSMTLSSPGLERLVPGPFRAEADRMAGSLALARGDGDATLRHATDAVRADPGSALALSLLGSAHFLKGDEQQADDAFRVAAQRGWRDLLTQLYWFDMALGTGDYRLAALRADAVSRTDAMRNEAALMREALETTEGGRAALAERLAEQPAWAEIYFQANRETELTALRNKSAMAITAGNIRKQGCDAIRNLTRALLDRGMQREAVEVWRVNCDPAVAGGLSDGSFDQLADTGKRSPFGWRRHLSGDVSVEVISDGESGPAVRLRNSSNVRKLALSQAIQLAPGTYRIRATVRSDGPSSIGQVAASLDCDGAARRPAASTGELAGDGQLIEVSECARPMLGLWLSPGVSGISIDNVTIEPVPPR